MSELSNLINSYHHWTINGDKKIVTPKNSFPKCAYDRIKYFLSENNFDMGMTPMGALEFIIAENEEKAREDYEFGGAEWLPVTQEFKNWRDGSYMSIKQSKILLAVLYGIYELEKQI